MGGHFQTNRRVQTDEYFELDPPTALEEMVGEEIVVEGADVVGDLEAVIRQHLGLPRTRKAFWAAYSGSN
jgi:hypothetical protein